MEFGFTEEQQKFRQELGDFLRTEPRGEVTAGVAGGYSATFYRRLAEKGYLGLQYPEEYGGQGKDAIFEAIFAEEMGYADAPLHGYTLTVLECGNIILKYGTEKQKKEYLPRITRGEIRFGHAYTEPEAGTDLAAVQTRAIRQGDCYVISGQKMFWSTCHERGCSILSARTAPGASPEEGFSLFIVEHSSPGIACSAMTTMGGTRTNQAFLDDVKVPVENLIGEENRGWEYFMGVRVYYLFQNVAIYVGNLRRMFDDVVQHVRVTNNHSHPLGQSPQVRRKLAEMASDISAMRLLTYRVAWTVSQGHDALPLAAALKVFSDEALPRLANSAMHILGPCGQLEGKYAPLKGAVEEAYRRSAQRSFSNGGPGITRNAVATYLGLPDCQRDGAGIECVEVERV